MFTWLWSVLSSNVGDLAIGLIRRALGLQDDHEQLRDILKRLRSHQSQLVAIERNIGELKSDDQAIALTEETEYQEIAALKAQLGACEIDVLEMRKLLTAQHELVFDKIQEIFERLEKIETKP